MGFSPSGAPSLTTPPLPGPPAPPGELRAASDVPPPSSLHGMTLQNCHVTIHQHEHHETINQHEHHYHGPPPSKPHRSASHRSASHLRRQEARLAEFERRRGYQPGPRPTPHASDHEEPPPPPPPPLTPTCHAPPTNPRPEDDPPPDGRAAPRWGGARGRSAAFMMPLLLLLVSFAPTSPVPAANITGRPLPARALNHSHPLLPLARPTLAWAPPRPLDTGLWTTAHPSEPRPALWTLTLPSEPCRRAPAPPQPALPGRPWSSWCVAGPLGAHFRWSRSHAPEGSPSPPASNEAASLPAYLASTTWAAFASWLPTCPAVRALPYWRWPTFWPAQEVVNTRHPLPRAPLPTTPPAPSPPLHLSPPPPYTPYDLIEGGAFGDEPPTPPPPLDAHTGPRLPSPGLGAAMGGEDLGPPPALGTPGEAPPSATQSPRPGPLAPPVSPPAAAGGAPPSHADSPEARIRAIRRTRVLSHHLRIHLTSQASLIYKTALCLGFHNPDVDSPALGDALHRLVSAICEATAPDRRWADHPAWRFTESIRACTCLGCAYCGVWKHAQWTLELPPSVRTHHAGSHLNQPDDTPFQWRTRCNPHIDGMWWYFSEAWETIHTLAHQVAQEDHRSAALPALETTFFQALARLRTLTPVSDAILPARAAFVHLRLGDVQRLFNTFITRASDDALPSERVAPAPQPFLSSLRDHLQMAGALEDLALSTQCPDAVFQTPAPADIHDILIPFQDPTITALLRAATDVWSAHRLNPSHPQDSALPTTILWMRHFATQLQGAHLSPRMLRTRRNCTHANDTFGSLHPEQIAGNPPLLDSCVCRYCPVWPEELSAWTLELDPEMAVMWRQWRVGASAQPWGPALVPYILPPPPSPVPHLTACYQAVAHALADSLDSFPSDPARVTSHSQLPADLEQSFTRHLGPASLLTRTPLHRQPFWATLSTALRQAKAAPTYLPRRAALYGALAESLTSACLAIMTVLTEDTVDQLSHGRVAADDALCRSLLHDYLAELRSHTDGHQPLPQLDGDSGDDQAVMSKTGSKRKTAERDIAPLLHLLVGMIRYRYADIPTIASEQSARPDASAPLGPATRAWFDDTKSQLIAADLGVEGSVEERCQAWAAHSMTNRDFILFPTSNRPSLPRGVKGRAEGFLRDRTLPDLTKPPSDPALAQADKDFTEFLPKFAAQAEELRSNGAAIGTACLSTRRGAGAAAPPGTADPGPARGSAPAATPAAAGGTVALCPATLWGSLPLRTVPSGGGAQEVFSRLFMGAMTSGVDPNALLGARAGDKLRPVHLAEEAASDDIDDILKSFAAVKLAEPSRSQVAAGTGLFSRDAVLGAREWVRGNETGRLTYSIQHNGSTIPGYLQPSSDDLGPESELSQPGAPHIQVVISFIPARVFGFELPASRQAAALVIQNLLTAIDGTLQLVANEAGHYNFSLAGNPAILVDSNRHPIHAKTWMHDSPALRDIILRRREICFPGGPDHAPGPEPIRISHIPESPTYAEITGLSIAAQCAFKLCPSLMHERILCDMALAFFRVCAGPYVTAVTRYIDWSTVDPSKGAAGCTQPGLKFIVLGTNLRALQLLKACVDNIGGLPFWMIAPELLLDPVRLRPRLPEELIPCRLHISTESAQIARTQALRANPPPLSRLDCHFSSVEALARTAEAYHGVYSAGDLSLRLLSTLKSGYAAAVREGALEVPWVASVRGIHAWPIPDNKPRAGQFSGEGLTITFTSEDARLQALIWAYAQHRAESQGLLTHPLWPHLPHHKCGGRFQFTVPDGLRPDGSKGPVLGVALVAKAALAIQAPPPVTGPPLDHDLLLTEPPPWTTPSVSAAASGVSKAVALLQSFLARLPVGQNAFLIAHEVSIPDADEDAPTTSAIPFDASYSSATITTDVQLAPFMLAHGASAAATYLAAEQLRTQSELLIHPCLQKPFYQITPISSLPPPSLPPATPSPPQPTHRLAIGPPPAGTTSSPPQICRHGDNCRNHRAGRCPHSHPQSPATSTPGQARAGQPSSRPALPSGGSRPPRSTPARGGAAWGPQP